MAVLLEACWLRLYLLVLIDIALCRENGAVSARPGWLQTVEENGDETIYERV